MSDVTEITPTPTPDLQALIDAAVAKAVAAQPQSSRADAVAIGESVAAAIDRLHPRKVTQGQFESRIKRKPIRPGVTFFQNGFNPSRDKLSDEEVDLINKITRPGKYIDRKVEVVIVENSPDESFIDIRYKNKTNDQKLAAAAFAPTLAVLLKRIVDEQTQLLKEEEEWRESKQAVVDAAREAKKDRAAFGKSKAFQDALAKAAEREK